MSAALREDPGGRRLFWLAPWLHPAFVVMISRIRITGLAKLAHKTVMPQHLAARVLTSIKHTPTEIITEISELDI